MAHRLHHFLRTRAQGRILLQRAEANGRDKEWLASANRVNEFQASDSPIGGVGVLDSFIPELFHPFFGSPFALLVLSHFLYLRRSLFFCLWFCLRECAHFYRRAAVHKRGGMPNNSGYQSGASIKRSSSFCQRPVGDGNGANSMPEYSGVQYSSRIQPYRDRVCTTVRAFVGEWTASC